MLTVKIAIGAPQNANEDCETDAARGTMKNLIPTQRLLQVITVTVHKGAHVPLSSFSGGDAEERGGRSHGGAQGKAGGKRRGRSGVRRLGQFQTGVEVMGLRRQTNTWLSREVTADEGAACPVWEEAFVFALTPRCARTGAGGKEARGKEAGGGSVGGEGAGREGAWGEGAGGTGGVLEQGAGVLGEEGRAADDSGGTEGVEGGGEVEVGDVRFVVHEVLGGGGADGVVGTAYMSARFLSFVFTPKPSTLNS